jgi:hypothetical protein
MLQQVVQLQTVPGTPATAITQIQVMQFHNRTIKRKLKLNKNILKMQAEFFSCVNESAVRQRWRKNTAGR